MEKKQMLEDNSEFAGYRIAGRLSRRHDGAREVYRAVDSDGRSVALTVFDIRSPRYAAEGSARRRTPDFIDEVRFYMEYASAGDKALPGLPECLGCGIDSCRRHRYGWAAMEYVDGESLDSVIRRQGRIAMDDALEITARISAVVEAAAKFTGGGGHYNISTDNIIVRYEGDVLRDVRLVGFANIGTLHGGDFPAGADDPDSRFRAPETYRRIYSRRSDIYSLGMVLLVMLAGYPEVIQTGEYAVDAGGDVDMTDVSSADFGKSVWKAADKSLPRPLRLVLRKATDTAPSARFASVGKLNEFLAKVTKRDMKAQAAPGEPKPAEAQPAYGYAGAPVAPAAGDLAAVGDTMTAAGKSPGRKALDEVAGMSELKALFRRDFIRIVRNPKVAQAYGIKPSNCTLLYGPQGCGKTFIAEKAAQESGLRYKIVNPSELGSIYVHGSQQKIAELFAEAEKNGPMILIFDEFDALVPKRDSELNVNQANEVNEMLTQLNNCASRGIYVLATTNRPSLLDPAIMRKGRIDRTVYVSLPDMEARAELFRLEIARRPNTGMDYELLAKATDNYTGSDITFIVEESARLCFEETLDRQLDEPVPLSMPRLMDVIKSTQSSVSEAQRKEYLEIRARMEDREAYGRKKVGFIS